MRINSLRCALSLGDSSTYDYNGNTVSELVEAQTNSYNYDSQNRLIEANMGGIVQAMSYDPDGIRISKASSGEETHYLTDTNRDYAQVLYETSPTNELQYTFGLDLVGLDTGNESYTYHSDALGSTRLLTNNAGDVADDVRYDAWGEQLFGGEVSENQYLYTGEQFDVGLGKTYLRARYYTAGVGRFSQMDSWLGVPFQPVSLNKYLYAGADSVGNIDPSGRSFLGILSVRSSIQSALLTATRSQSLVMFGGNAVKAGAKALSIVCVAQAISSLMPIPEPLAKKKQLGCYLNQMRVQLQKGSSDTIGKLAAWPADPGVSVEHVRGKLSQLYLARNNGGWFPTELDSWLYRSIVRMSIKLKGVPLSGGIFEVGTILSEKTYLKKVNFRLDLENLRGHNLRW